MKLFKLLFLIAVGLASLAVVLRNVSTTKIYSEGGRLEASNYDLSMFDGSGQLLFSISPLNDYYYYINLKDHLINTVSESKNGNQLDEALLSLERLFLRKERLIWQMSGKNIRGEASVDFNIDSNGQRIEITREIKNNGPVTSLGLVINFCQSCLIADEGKRLYFNGDLLTQEKVAVAKKLGFAPIVLGENQSLPNDGRNILFLNREGKLLFKIPTSGSEVFLQEQWHLLEFKKQADSLNVTQEIYLKSI